MARNRWAMACILGGTLMAGLLILPVASQTGGEYELVGSTIAGSGGGEAAGGDYALTGTLGQLDAHVLRGGDYEVGGGFWGGGETTPPSGDQRVNLPLIQR